MHLLLLYNNENLLHKHLIFKFLRVQSNDITFYLLALSLSLTFKKSLIFLRKKEERCTRSSRMHRWVARVRG